MRLIRINTPCQNCAFHPWDAHGFRKVNKLPHLSRDGGGERKEVESTRLMQIQKSTYRMQWSHIYSQELLLFCPYLQHHYEEIECPCIVSPSYSRSLSVSFLLYSWQLAAGSKFGFYPICCRLMMKCFLNCSAWLSTKGFSEEMRNNHIRTDACKSI